MASPLHSLEPMSQFSLFEGDLVNRAFSRLRLGNRRPLDLLGRMGVLIAITWVPMAIIAWFSPSPPDASTAQNFFYDFAAYAQFFIGLPLFVIAEKVIDAQLLSAARDFADSGVVATADLPELARIERDVERARKKPANDWIGVALAYAMALMTIGPELFWQSGMSSWHVEKIDVLTRHLTYPGAWEMFVALPIQIYWWVRWVWKICLWYWYLSQVSRFHLVLAASHPDHTAGIAFLSEVQSHFAIVILAYGISNVVATVGYKITVEHAPAALPGVWGPIVGFSIGAPLLFLCPLLLFSKQLYRTKKRALAQFREKAMRSAVRVEEEWLRATPDKEQEAIARNELSQLNLLTGFYERIHVMRVVPFDLRSAAQLIGSAVGPMIPLLPHFVTIPEPWKTMLEALTKWLPH